MNLTERKYWINGHQKRGTGFHTLNLSMGNIGVMLAWGKYTSADFRYFSINLFRLTN